jgi:hypothetical protein
MSLQPHDSRRYFEYALSDMARPQSCDPKSFRLGFKYCLKLCRFIRKSTKEINDDTLRKMAEAIRRDLDPPPPEPYPCSPTSQLAYAH